MIKRKKKFTDPSGFLTKWMTQEEVIRLAKAAQKRLEAEYIKNNCRRQIGEYIFLDPTANPPWNKFQIADIEVEILPTGQYKNNNVGESVEVHNIGLVYKGHFIDPEFNRKKGTLRIRDTKPENDNTGNGDIEITEEQAVHGAADNFLKSEEAPEPATNDSDGNS